MLPSFVNRFLIACTMVCCGLSCNKPVCECDFKPEQYIEAIFINQQGQNLIFGASSRFVIDSIQVLKEKNRVEVNNASVSTGIINAVNVRLNFYTPEEKSFIYYNAQTSPDSLEIEWMTRTGRCCGGLQTYNVVKSVKFNSVLIEPKNGIYFFVK